MKMTTTAPLPYTIDDILSLAQRENNSKRSYLLVNRFQAKHIPVSPARALELFDRLGKAVYPHIAGNTVTFVGFAETATAIGARLAAEYPGEAFYIQTTREDVSPEMAVVNFLEEHSHATEQKLFCADRVAMLQSSDLILFVEDEITTGKTILNFITALQNAGYHKKFGVASLFNSMSAEHLERFRDMDVAVYAFAWLENVHTLFRLDHPEAPQKAGSRDELPSLHKIGGRTEPRAGLPASDYRNACASLADDVFNMISKTPLERILVLGTEECMYPAICCAGKIEQEWPQASVVVHATTRSPILPGSSPGYPLKSRNNLDSMYQPGRPTFVYNLDRYDLALVVTDALGINPVGARDLSAALKAHGTNRVEIIEWVE